MRASFLVILMSAAVMGGCAANLSPDQQRAAVASNERLLFSSDHQIALGNAQGDVTLVEFFDYNCGYCKHSLPDMLTLLKHDPKLKIVLKEYPILGPGSVEAARVAIAVRMQDPTPQKYLAFHTELLGNPGRASEQKALAAARDQGLDMTRLEKDLSSEEVTAALNEDRKLASSLGIRGTPEFVIGNEVVRGGVELAGLQAKIDTARGHPIN